MRRRYAIQTPRVSGSAPRSCGGAPWKRGEAWRLDDRNPTGPATRGRRRSWDFGAGLGLR
jgi:hypothetical protein